MQLSFQGEFSYEIINCSLCGNALDGSFSEYSDRVIAPTGEHNSCEEAVHSAENCCLN